MKLGQGDVELEHGVHDRPHRGRNIRHRGPHQLQQQHANVGIVIRRTVLELLHEFRLKMHERRQQIFRRLFSAHARFLDQRAEVGQQLRSRLAAERHQFRLLLIVADDVEKS